MPPGPHVFAEPVLVDSITPGNFVAGEPSASSWVSRGVTDHFEVFYDPQLTDMGKQFSDHILGSCENDYAVISAIFSGIKVPKINVRIYSFLGGRGAYHYGCTGTDFYCDVEAGNPSYTSMLIIAELVEVFSAFQNLGWDCASSNGEGLSRVLATELYPTQLDGFTSAANWLDGGGRQDWVNKTEPTDRNYVSIGCSTLFLNYLHYQLKFSWHDIVSTGGSTLSYTYEKLTGAADGYLRFKMLLEKKYPSTMPAGVKNDNPFPIVEEPPPPPPPAPSPSPGILTRFVRWLRELFRKVFSGSS